MSKLIIPKRFSLNRPQLLTALANATIQVDKWPRGTGKSTGFSWKSKKISHVMPRGRFAFIGPSYQRLLTRTLPPVIKQWEKFGYYQDSHYVIGTKPPKEWPKPFLAPLDYKHFITWYTGAGFDLVSQDRSGDSRGPDWDYLLMDEGLTLDYFKLQTETFATLRGNKQEFSTSLHHGITVASSQPYDSAGAWISEFGNYYLENGHDYAPLKQQLVKLQLEFIDSNDLKLQSQLWLEILEIKRKIKYYKHHYNLHNKKMTLFYSEADIFDNIENVGFNYIKSQRRVLSDMMFKVEILNSPVDKVEDGFYPYLSDKHKYIKFDNDAIDSFNFNFDELTKPTSRFDGDIDPHTPLDIAIDPGYHINFMVVGQLNTTSTKPDYRFVNALFVKKPKLIQDVVDKFCDYYSAHQYKTVRYVYDQTSTGHHASSKLTYAEEVIKRFHERGWNVEQVHIGAVPDPQERYLFWGVALAGNDQRLPGISFNRDHCKYLLISMELTGVIASRDGFKKEKKWEKNSAFPQEEAPHASDAADTLFFGLFATDMGKRTNTLGMAWSSSE